MFYGYFYGYVSKTWNKYFSQIFYFSLKLWLTTFFAQQIQIDKMHHRKAEKISYVEVYLVILGQFI